MRAYIGQCLRTDLERLEGQGDLESLIASLRKHGVEETVIASAVAEARADAYPSKRE